MSDTDLMEIAEETLLNISNAIEAADSSYELEVDTKGDAIEITFPDGSKYLINIHSTSEQIWVASPISGGSHFTYDEAEGMWKDSSETYLYELITEEIEELGGVSIRLS